MSWLSDLLQAYGQGEALKRWGPGWQDKLAALRASTANLGYEGERTQAQTRLYDTQGQAAQGELGEQNATRDYFTKSGKTSQAVAKFLEDQATAQAARAASGASVEASGASTAETRAKTGLLPTPDEARKQREAELGLTKSQSYRNYKAPTEPGQYTWMNDPSGNLVYKNPKSGNQLEGYTQPPTAEMRNKSASRSLVQKSIVAVEDLSKRLITKVGVGQRATAAVRGIDAVLGNDPEYRTYQDARMALAGNLAVGQQGSRPSDADIKAIWLPMVPDVFRDTKDSAAMKWNFIRVMSSPEMPGGQPPGTPPGGSLDEFFKGQQ